MACVSSGISRVTLIVLSVSVLHVAYVSQWATCDSDYNSAYSREKSKTADNEHLKKKLKYLDGFLGG